MRAVQSLRCRRRLRAMLRYERQSIAMVLATVSHHLSGKVDTANGASRGKTTATRTGGRGLLSEPEPQGQERPRTFPRRSQVAPEPRPLVHLGVGEVHDGPLVSFLLQHALLERRKEEEVKQKQMLDLELRSLREVPVQSRSPEQVRRITALLKLRTEALSSSSKRRRKKRIGPLLSPLLLVDSGSGIQGRFCWFRSYASVFFVCRQV